jgi:indolepyruvate ferredoxin oxidoreductase beta subunit
MIMDSKKDFNMVIVGTGGQGLLTLLKILAEAAFFEKKDVKTSELHGLSQRGGSVEVQIRFGREIFSPLVFQDSADLVLALELHESLRALYYANKKTKFLINDYLIPIPGQNPIQKEEILSQIKRFTKNLTVVNATGICKKELGKEILAGIYLLGYAVNKKMIPLKLESVLEAIKKVIPEKYLELNLKAFDLVRTT